jgi:hypothetical protein
LMPGRRFPDFSWGDIPEHWRIRQASPNNSRPLA